MLKLLIVDDEPDICDFVKNFFKERNFEVLIAHNGREALDVVTADAPDIVLLDMKMPEMNGIEALKEMNRRGNRPKVIMVTAVEDSETAEEAKNFGAIEYITKPLLLEQLERTVLRVAEAIKMSV